MNIVGVVGYVLIGVIVLLIVFGIVFLRISVYKDTIGISESTYVPLLEKEYPGMLDWFESMKTLGKVESRYIVNRTGLRLHAYFVEAEHPQATVVLVHGYSGCSLQTIPHARMYFEKFGYNIVMLDLAHHSKSEGKVTGMGWVDRLDLIQWVDEVDRYFSERRGPLPIVLHGLSMGGSCVLMAAGEGLPSCVKALIDDSGFSSAFAEFSHEITTKLHLPVFPFAYAADLVGRLFLGWSFIEASALPKLGEVELPLLIIHGNGDRRVVIEEGLKIKASKTKGLVEMWEVENGEHIKALRMYPDEYASKVRGFLEKTIL